MWRAVFVASVGLLLTGCTENHQTCQFGLSAPLPGLLNPQTGVCEFHGGGGQGQDPCIGVGRQVPGDQIDWAMCGSTCNQFDEAECIAAPGCRASYIGTCTAEDNCDNDTYSFHECWSTAPSGPVSGSCEGLGAHECSRHHSCVARHSALEGTGCGAGNDCAPEFRRAIGAFDHCAAEPGPQGCYGDHECSDGTRCNAAELCLPPPGCEPGAGCGGACYGYCVPAGSGGRVGTCDEAMCDAPTPMCPDGTVPGVADGCYTGFCIPKASCGLDPS